MKKHKLVLTFNEEDELLGIEPCLIFNNELDAEKYLLETGIVTKVTFMPKDKLFSFSTESWKGCGVACWAVDNS